MTARRKQPRMADREDLMAIMRSSPVPRAESSVESGASLPAMESAAGSEAIGPWQATDRRLLAAGREAGHLAEVPVAADRAAHPPGTIDSAPANRQAEDRGDSPVAGPDELLAPSTAASVAPAGPSPGRHGSSLAPTASRDASLHLKPAAQDPETPESSSPGNKETGILGLAAQDDRDSRHLSQAGFHTAEQKALQRSKPEARLIKKTFDLEPEDIMRLEAEKQRRRFQLGQKLDDAGLSVLVREAIRARYPMSS